MTAQKWVRNTGARRCLAWANFLEGPAISR